MKLNREIVAALRREGLEVLGLHRKGRHPVVDIKTADGRVVHIAIPHKVRGGAMMKNFISQMRRKTGCRDRG